MLHKSKGITVYILLLNITATLMIAYFLNIYKQQDYSINLLTESAFELSIGTLDNDKKKLIELNNIIKNIDIPLVLYKNLPDNGVAVYTNDYSLVEEVPIDIQGVKDNKIFIANKMKNKLINNEISIENTSFEVEEIYENKGELSNFFIDLFNLEFSENAVIDGSYVIDTKETYRNELINELNEKLGGLSDQITYKISNLLPPSSKIFIDIISSERIFAVIFFLIIVFILMNLNIAIFNWINANKITIFCRIISGAQEIQIRNMILYEYTKLNLGIGLITFFIGYLVNSLVGMSSLSIYFKYIFIVLIIFYIIQVIILLIQNRIFNTKRSLVEMMREVRMHETI